MDETSDRDPAIRPSPLGLAVLSLLHAAPLHPYAIQRLLKLWGKDHVINVGQRASLYKTIRRLTDAGLVAVRQTERDQQYPERTVYELTEAGRQLTQSWLADMLARPRAEFPQFPAALSFIMLLSPAEAADLLRQREQVLRADLTALTTELASLRETLPRVVLMDDEYRAAVLAAEVAWLAGVVADLRAGGLGWSEAELAGLAAASVPDGDLPGPPPAGQ